MKVHVTKGKRDKWVLRWYDADKKLRQRTTDLRSVKSNYKDALKLAAQLESELAGEVPPNLVIPKRKTREQFAGEPDAPEMMDGDWQRFRTYFFDTHMSGLSEHYATTMRVALDNFEDWSKVTHVSDVTTNIARRWVAHLRESGLATATVRSYWRHLSSFIGIAVDDGLRKPLGRVRLPKHNSSRFAKGRAISLEEFERMKEAAKSVSPDRHESLSELLEGLWLSGLRTGEAHRLTWRESGFYVEMEGFPNFVILEQKNKEAQRLPMVPELIFPCVALIVATPGASLF